MATLYLYIRFVLPILYVLYVCHDFYRYRCMYVCILCMYDSVSEIKTDVCMYVCIFVCMYVCMYSVK